jgi:hypothetical protein
LSLPDFVLTVLLAMIHPSLELATSESLVKTTFCRFDMPMPKWGMLMP